MRNVLVSALVLGVIGLVVGYFLFAGSGGNYVPVWRVLGISHNVFQDLGNQLATRFGDLAVVRRNILISGLVGVVLGFVIALSSRRRRR